MSSWTDLDRPPLSARRLQRALGNGPVWREVRLVELTTSTNADVATAARSGAAEGLVVVAEEQRAGRGRLERSWVSPPRAGLLLSVLLRPAAPVSELSVVPLLAGVAAVEALRGVGEVEVSLKWPNDLVVGDRKIGGILVERVGDGVVIGIGINVTTRLDEMPTPQATSVAVEGGHTDRESLVKEVLRALARRYLAFRDTPDGRAGVLAAYRQVCETIGRRIELQLPGGTAMRGVATGVDDSGRIMVEDDAGNSRAWSAGDVLHLRAGG